MKQFKVGYTTGVFDMFHIGHLNVIKNAKQYCETLIVGVSTDDLVEEYKKRRPIIPYEERIEIVSSITYVDEAVAQTSMDKLKAWEHLHYDVLFHGDDWKNSSMYNQIVGQLKKVGVEVMFLPYTKNISTTSILEKMNKV